MRIMPGLTWTTLPLHKTALSLAYGCALPLVGLPFQEGLISTVIAIYDTNKYNEERMIVKY